MSLCVSEIIWSIPMIVNRFRPGVALLIPEWTSMIEKGRVNWCFLGETNDNRSEPRVREYV